jgi:CheY-like chemotaxis protein
MKSLSRKPKAISFVFSHKEMARIQKIKIAKEFEWNNVTNLVDLFYAIKSDFYDLLIFEDSFLTEGVLLNLPEIRECMPMSYVVMLEPQKSQESHSQSRARFVKLMMSQVNDSLNLPLSDEDSELMFARYRHFQRFGFSRKHMLVIHSDRLIRQFISSSLIEAGHMVSEVRRYEEAFDRQDFDHIDLVIGGLCIDGMGGIEGIPKLLSISPNLNLLAIEGDQPDMPAASSLKAALKVGATQTLAWRCTQEELKKAVLKALGDFYVAA